MKKVSPLPAPELLHQEPKPVHPLLKSYFAEWSLLWLDAIISLRAIEIKLGGVNNGK